MDIWVIENCDGVCKICATKEIALREVLRMLRIIIKKILMISRNFRDYRALMEK